MDRRAFCASAVGVGLAGCLNLQEDTVSDGSGGDGEGARTDTEGSEGGPAVDPIEDLSLSPVWDLEGSFIHVGAAAGSLFGSGFDGLVRVEPDGTESWTSDVVGDDYAVRLDGGIDAVDGGLFVGTSGSEVDRARLYALEGDSGRERWYDETDPTGTRTRIQHVVATRSAVVYGSDTGGTDENQHAVVRALDPVTGEEHWVDTFPETFVVGLERVDDRIFVGTTEHLWCYDVASGDRVAEFDVLSGFEGIAGDGASCYGYDRTENELVAIDGAALERRWDEPVPHQPEGMAVGNGLLTVTTDAGYVVAYDAATGSPRWETRVGGPARERPVPDGNRIWIADESGTLTALAAADGTPVFETDGGDGGSVDVAVVDDVLLTDADETAYTIEET